MKTVFLRVLEELQDKESALRTAIRNPEAARSRQRFDVDPHSFAGVPGSPFAYWVSEHLRELFTELPALQADGRAAASGGKTLDDFRWIRAAWEVIPKAGAGWVGFAKGGAFSPFYADIYLLLDWQQNARALKEYLVSYRSSRGWSPNWTAELHGSDHYLRPGLTWSRRTKSELSLRVMPAMCVFGDKGPAIFVENDSSEDLLSLLAIGSSRAFRSLVEFQLAAADAKRGGAARSYEVGVIQRTPVPTLKETSRRGLARLAHRAWSLRRSLDTQSEVSHAFSVPALLQVAGANLGARAAGWFANVRAADAELGKIQAEIDALSFELYSIAESDRRAILDGFHLVSSEFETADEIDDAEDDTDEPDEIGPGNATSLAAELVSWMVGVAFGRFDVRLGTEARPLTAEPGPFDPLPVCSPGVLTGEDGMPLTSAPAGYPVAFPQNGILVDDLGHAHDLTTAVRAVFEEVFNAGVDSWWNEVGSVLAPKDHELRTWLTSSFFEHHLRRYSKSRRRAPILWQLAVPSGRYSVWLYAHLLTRDSFFQIQNDVVTPKLVHEERLLTSLIESAGANPSAMERKEIAEQEAFVGELRSFLYEIKRVAPLWNPVLDDGVSLTMAPLWRLAPQHKPWQKELKSKWDELAAGKYDWAHIAMHMWPERVVPKCVADRSLAIAHGLEDAFWVEGLSGHWRQRVSIADTVRYLEKNLYSDRLRETVEELIAFSQAHAETSGDGPGWWAALSSGDHDDLPLALALWPERVLRQAVADPTRFTTLGIKPPSVRTQEELLAKLLKTHRPRLLEHELQTLGEFCGNSGDHDIWQQLWAELAAGVHDDYGLARAVHTARVVAKAQADPSFAELHDLFRWFWLFTESGPRRLKEPPDEIADAVRGKTSIAVKAALKSLLEAPAATVGDRGRSRQAAAAAADGETR